MSENNTNFEMMMTNLGQLVEKTSYNVAAISQQIGLIQSVQLDHGNRLNELDTRITFIENNERITRAQQSNITGLVKTRVGQLLGI